jgi:hypothetical protein
MELRWYILESSLGEESPAILHLPESGVVALVVSVHDPAEPGSWLAAEHGEQRSQGAGFHASYAAGAGGDVVTVWFDGRLRGEAVRVAWAVVSSQRAG